VSEPLPRQAPLPPLTVTELTRMVSNALTASLPPVLRVSGQIADFSRPTSGHLYFTLKDATCQVRCVMWRSAAEGMKFRPADGLEVLATGSIEVYEARGQYQLYVRRLEPVGVGALELAFRQLKEKLGREGLFDPARKRPLPAYPRCVAIVTSPTGAAIRDILQTLARRFPALRVLVVPVRVQGEGSAQEIAVAIRRLNEQGERLGGIDVMIVGRGGGSLEDLWAFNEEIVARAIAASRIPVVSAVGHEVDFTIADFVADVRAATPTAAAEIVAPVLADLLERLDALRVRLTRDARRTLELATARLDRSARSEWFRDPIGRLRQRGQRLDDASARLSLGWARRLAVLRDRLHVLERRLARVRPDVVWARRREHLERLQRQLSNAMQRKLLLGERRLAHATAALTRQGPQRSIDRGRAGVGPLAARLERAVSHRFVLLGQRLEALSARLAASSHEQVLKRGFTITRLLRTGRLVRARTDVKPDDRIITQTSNGEISSRVLDDRQGELFE